MCNLFPGLWILRSLDGLRVVIDAIHGLAELAVAEDMGHDVCFLGGVRCGDGGIDDRVADKGW